MSSPKPVQIIGIGSPFGDDRAGWEVIRRLEQRAATRAESAADRPGPARQWIDPPAETGFAVLAGGCAPQ